MASPVEPGKTVEQAIKGGEAQCFSLRLEADQCLALTVEQEGIDLTLRIGQAGKEAGLVVDNPTGSWGPEILLFVASSAGDYRLTVESPNRTAREGRYRLQVEPLRLATATDRTRLAAMQAAMTGDRERKKQTKAGFEAALVQYEKARAGFQEAGDRRGEADALTQAGACAVALGDFPKAAQSAQQAQDLRRAGQDVHGEAFALNALGTVAYSQGQPKKALEYLTQARDLFRKTPDREAEANALKDMGVMYSQLGDKRKALEHAQAALPILQELGDRRGEASALNNIGRAYDGLGERAKAIDSYSQALAIRRELKDRQGEMTILNNLGMTNEQTGETKKAQEAFDQTLSLSRTLGNRLMEARVLTNLGRVYDTQGELDKALEVYQQALTKYRELGNQLEESAVLNNIGTLYQNLGELDRAVEYAEQSLKLCQETKDKTGEGTALVNLAIIYLSFGKYQKSIQYLHQALSFYDSLQNTSGQSDCMVRLGLVYFLLGRREPALKILNQGLIYKQKNNDQLGQASCLVTIARIQMSQREFGNAIKTLEESLSLARSCGSRQIESEALGYLGLIRLFQKEYQPALEYLSQAYKVLSREQNRQRMSGCLGSIGFVYLYQGQYEMALNYTRQALALAETDKYVSVNSLLFQMAQIEYNLGHLERALQYAEQMIANNELSRADIADFSLRSSFLESIEIKYKYYIYLLMQSRKANPSVLLTQRAFEASERRRARSLLDLLNESHAQIQKGVASETLAAETSLHQKIQSKAQQALKLRGLAGKEKQAEAVERETEQLLEELSRLQAEIRLKSPNYAALTQAKTSSLEEIQSAVLDEDTVLLEYTLISSGSYVWAVTKQDLTSYALPPSAEIEAAAKTLYRLLTERPKEERQWGKLPLAAREEARHQADADYGEAARRLSDLILKPLAAQLKAKRVIVVPDGMLQYIPFGALPLPESGPVQPLLRTHEVVTAPSASVLALQKQMERRTPAEKLVAVVADPVFQSSDTRIRQQARAKTAPAAQDPNPALAAPPDPERDIALGQFKQTVAETQLAESELLIPRLPATRREAQDIAALVPVSKRLTALDFAASRELVTSGRLADYQVVHFATHGLVNDRHPELSGLVLSLVDETGRQREGFLRMIDIFNLDLKADLVVLSACQTGIGKEVKGEGLMGLSRAFLYAGAKSTIVSLWSVNDRATAELMSRFYHHLLQQKQRPAAALRAAQLEMVEQTPWKSPYYWAAFTVNGSY